MSSEPKTPLHCQHVSPRGRHCHMLLDQNQTPSNAKDQPALCSYHASRTKAIHNPPDPETLAAELLGNIRNFSKPDSVNRFLGNLVKQLARKRIARRDAIALAYISQLLLNTFPAMQRQREEDAMNVDLSRELLAGLARSPQSANNAPPSHPIFTDLQLPPDQKARRT
jgi:hypothetical protein